MGVRIAFADLNQGCALLLIISFLSSSGSNLQLNIFFRRFIRDQPIFDQVIYICKNNLSRIIILSRCDHTEKLIDTFYQEKTTYLNG